MFKASEYILYTKTSHINNEQNNGKYETSSMHTYGFLSTRQAETTDTEFVHIITEWTRKRINSLNHQEFKNHRSSEQLELRLNGWLTLVYVLVSLKKYYIKIPQKEKIVTNTIHLNCMNHMSYYWSTHSFNYFFLSDGLEQSKKYHLREGIHAEKQLTFIL